MFDTAPRACYLQVNPASLSPIVKVTIQATSIIDRDSRILSVDVFRGVVMFLMIAEATGLYERLVVPAFEDTVISAVGLQFRHHPWRGMRLWDLGQPFFMFISGVTMSFSYHRRWEADERWGGTLKHALKRSLLLFVLGWAIYLIAPEEGSSPRAFLYDVFPHLAFASFVAFLVLRRPAVQLILLAFGLIAVSDLLYRLWMVPGYDQPFVAGHNFGSYVDRLLLGGVSSEYWVAFNMVPAAAFVIWGALAGRLLRRRVLGASKVRTMLIIGLAGVALGLALNTFTPIIRRICTSSFVILSGGLCLLTLTLAFWLMDVWRVRKGAAFFAAVGMNPLFIYLFAQTGGADWMRKIVAPFLQGIFSRVGEKTVEFAVALAILALMWGLCYGLYRRKLFIRI